MKKIIKSEKQLADEMITLEDKIMKTAFQKGGLVEQTSVGNYFFKLKDQYILKHNDLNTNEDVIKFYDDWNSRLREYLRNGVRL